MHGSFLSHLVFSRLQFVHTSVDLFLGFLPIGLAVSLLLTIVCGVSGRGVCAGCGICVRSAGCAPVAGCCACSPPSPAPDLVTQGRPPKAAYLRQRGSAALVWPGNRAVSATQFFPAHALALLLAFLRRVSQASGARFAASGLE